MVLFYLIKELFYNFFFIIYKMGECNSIENTNLTYYKKNRDMILNRAKDYYENNRERLRVQAREKYRNLSEEEKRLKEYQKNYCEAKKSQYITIK